MTTWEVICEDGVRRHAEPFPSRNDARIWSYWGHACTSKHQIRPITNTHTEEAS